MAINETRKIFIDKEQATGDFIMRIPEQSIRDLYDMILSAPLVQRRVFYHVKDHLEKQYHINNQKNK